MSSLVTKHTRISKTTASVFCGVCYDDFGDNLAAWALPCGHVYCLQCITKLAVKCSWCTWRFPFGVRAPSRDQVALRLFLNKRDEDPLDDLIQEAYRVLNERDRALQARVNELTVKVEERTNLAKYWKWGTWVLAFLLTVLAVAFAVQEAVYASTQIKA